MDGVGKFGKCTGIRHSKLEIGQSKMWSTGAIFWNYLYSSSLHFLPTCSMTKFVPVLVVSITSYVIKSSRFFCFHECKHNEQQLKTSYITDLKKKFSNWWMKEWVNLVTQEGHVIPTVHCFSSTISSQSSIFVSFIPANKAHEWIGQRLATEWPLLSGTRLESTWLSVSQTCNGSCCDPDRRLSHLVFDTATNWRTNPIVAKRCLAFFFSSSSP